MELVENEEEENRQENSEKEYESVTETEEEDYLTEEVAMIKKIDIILLIL